MAIAFESYSFSQNTASSDTSVSVSVPTGTADGNLVVAICWAASATVTPPAGFSDIVNGNTDYSIAKYVWVKTASSESGSYSFSHTSYDQVSVAVLRISGADNASVSASTGGESSFDTEVSCPDVNVTTAGSLIIWCHACFFNRTTTSNRGTEIHDSYNASASQVSTYHETISGTGNQTGAVITLSSSVTVKGTMSILIPPAAGAASGNPWYYYAQQMRQKLEEKLRRPILIPGFADCMRYGFAR